MPRAPVQRTVSQRGGKALGAWHLGFGGRLTKGLPARTPGHGAPAGGRRPVARGACLGPVGWNGPSGARPGHRNPAAAWGGRPLLARSFSSAPPLAKGLPRHPDAGGRLAGRGHCAGRAGGLPAARPGRGSAPRGRSPRLPRPDAGLPLDIDLHRRLLRGDLGPVADDWRCLTACPRCATPCPACKKGRRWPSTFPVPRPMPSRNSLCRCPCRWGWGWSLRLSAPRGAACQRSSRATLRRSSPRRTPRWSTIPAATRRCFCIAPLPVAFFLRGNV